MGSNSYLDIADRLKQDIIRNVVMPGQRLPTRVELERRFDTTPMTLNRAMKVLAEEGFVTARYGSSTQVATHPPHLTHFALAFPFESFDQRSRFFEALRDEAAKLRTEERRVSAFYGIESHVDVEDYQRLLGFVRAHRLAGLIFASDPYMLADAGSPLIRDPSVLRTAIMTPDRQFSFPTVYPDVAAFLPTAFDYLASRGRRRVAVVQLGGFRGPDLAPIQALATARGLIVRPHWLQAAFAGLPDWTRQLALVLLHKGQTERPDAVVITDDNLVEGFTAGIRDAGVRVVAKNEPFCKGGLEVVAQANFPYPTRSHVPAMRLGYSITRLMATCLDLIGKQQRGEDVPSHTAIPAEWEDSYTSNEGEAR